MQSVLSRAPREPSTQRPARPGAPDRFSYRVAKAANAAGVKATSHTLRHSLGSRMAREGHNAKAIQVALGQSDLATTMSYYSHLEPDDLPELAELLAERPELRR